MKCGDQGRTPDAENVMCVNGAPIKFTSSFLITVDPVNYNYFGVLALNVSVGDVGAHLNGNAGAKQEHFPYIACGPSLRSWPANIGL